MVPTRIPQLQRLFRKSYEVPYEFTLLLENHAQEIEPLIPEFLSAYIKTPMATPIGYIYRAIIDVYPDLLLQFLPEILTHWCTTYPTTFPNIFTQFQFSVNFLGTVICSNVLTNQQKYHFVSLILQYYQEHRCQQTGAVKEALDRGCWEVANLLLEDGYVLEPRSSLFGIVPSKSAITLRLNYNDETHRNIVRNIIRQNVKIMFRAAVDHRDNSRYHEWVAIMVQSVELMELIKRYASLGCLLDQDNPENAEKMHQLHNQLKEQYQEWSVLC